MKKMDYTLDEIQAVRNICSAFGVEEICIDFLCEGLDIDAVKARLTKIEAELKQERRR
jgi:hypothetical protein